MYAPPNATARSNDFEFEALYEAQNYREALLEEFQSSLAGSVLEIGAGIGQMTRHLLELPGVTRALAVEPDDGYCQKHQSLYPQHELLRGTAANVRGDWDAILSVNVLEHISEDEEELARYAGLLRARRGSLCLFVPARQEIYAPIDKDFGHFRRYSRENLRHRLQKAGFSIERLHYYNLPGYFAWWLNFRVLGKRMFEPAKVRFYDRVIFPTAHAIESKLVRPPFGQSLIAIARAA